MRYADFLMSVAPLALLIALMTKRQGMASQRALALTAAVLYAIRLAWFGTDPLLVHATVLDGLLRAWTPILIVWGAIFLFQVMDISGAMAVIRDALDGVTANRAGQLMIVGWAFEFLMDGAIGFGTPPALAAPILVGLGVAPVRAAMLCLVMNTVAVPLGAVGVPTWFGFSGLGLSAQDILQIGYQSAVINAVVSLVIPVVALRFVMSWREIRENLVFILLSILSCSATQMVLARRSVELPSLVGGAVGLAVTVALARWGVGMARAERPQGNLPQPGFGRVVKAMFPLWGMFLVLLATRVSWLPLKTWLNATAPAWTIPMGTLGTLALSPSGVVELKGILGTDLDFRHALLYVPSLVPFLLVGVISFGVLGMGKKEIGRAWRETWSRVRRPLLTFLGALVFARLLTLGGERSCTQIIGATLAGWAGACWTWGAAYLGALGTFFAGSNTVSNLTFGGIQQSVAVHTGQSVTKMLALQSVGSGMGKIVAINSIVAVCSILRIEEEEGRILKRVAWVAILYGAIAAATAVFL